MPPRRCLGCRTLVEGRSYCPTCWSTIEKKRDAARGTASARGLGSEWQKVRARTLARWRRQHGDLCPGYLRPPHEATPGNPLTVDHVIPRAERPDLTLEPSNLQVLCRSCNSAKGRRT